MTKHKRTAGLQHHPVQGSAAHIQESFDDDPLPSEQKILALHQIDPEILPWLKENIAKSRDQQHEYQMKKLDAKIAMDKSDRAERRNRRAFRWVAMLGAIVLMVGCCGAGGYLIYQGKPHGELLLGVPVMFVIGGLISATIDSKRKPKPQKTQEVDN